MNTIWKYLQYGYLIIAVILIVEAVLKWNNDTSYSFFMIGFAIFIILIFFFKRNFRKKIEKRNQQN